MLHEKTNLPLVGLVLCVLAGSLGAQRAVTGTSPSWFSLELVPALSVPLGGSTAVFGPSGGTTLAVSRRVQRMKGLTSRKLLEENRGLNKAFWGRHLWGRGYFVASVGNVSEEMIAAYIENQQEMERTQDADFKVEP